MEDVRMLEVASFYKGSVRWSYGVYRGAQRSNGNSSGRWYCSREGSNMGRKLRCINCAGGILCTWKENSMWTTFGIQAKC
ncbi:hypothetical protein PsorP6_004787 [Peronosclerospora sorghi]|uniref:Uncharacterized protein n=1 Tax=Peronosclerospora sorghi TaxID=230839 RepID=A0ACC0VP71_9STRA|nr:hypothetical protein PsorP6_004787 [Peronosclerospora sorghi]